jgi:hypothetical protein
MSGEPNHIKIRSVEYWQSRQRYKSLPSGQRPTLGQLRELTVWTWVYCNRCQHHAPMALAPLIIGWGAVASSDKLRQCARCTKCGHKGAAIQHPGWGGHADTGFMPFPT